MSSFSGLNGALTSLVAQRQSLEVAGQNIANVNTPGYTRQRANLQAIDMSAPASMHSTGVRTSGGGVAVTSIDRLGDLFLETRVRQESSSAEFLGAVAEVRSVMEAAISEPGEDGLAARLDQFFTSWQDIANRPDDPAAGAVLLENARTLTTHIAAAYQDVETQWESTRAQTAALTTEVNTTADAVADLNGRIRSVLVSGGTPNDLMDQRGELLNTLAGLVGGQSRERADGTVDVMVGGNALVRGDTAKHLAVEGTSSFAGLGAGTPAGPGEGSARLVWADSRNPAGASGGRLTGMLSTLAPAGDGGALAQLAETYNDLAGEIATKVNAAHDPGSGPVDFFRVDGAPAALGLTLAVTSSDQIVAGRTANGDLDGSVADDIAQLATEVGRTWSRAVVDLGVQTRTATQRAEAAGTTRANAENQLASRTGVDLDEETLNLLTSQRAYEAAARVLTTIDQTLDTLINRTGVVGR